MRRALDHPTRRRILRTLNDDVAEKTLDELASAVPGVSISTASYHVLVLEECGCVAVKVALPSGGPASRSLLAGAARDPAVIRALEATREVDAVDG